MVWSPTCISVIGMSSIVAQTGAVVAGVPSANRPLRTQVGVICLREHETPLPNLYVVGRRERDVRTSAGQGQAADRIGWNRIRMGRIPDSLHGLPRERHRSKCANARADPSDAAGAHL